MLKLHPFKNLCKFQHNFEFLSPQVSRKSSECIIFSLDPKSPRIIQSIPPWSSVCALCKDHKLAQSVNWCQAWHSQTMLGRALPGLWVSWGRRNIVNLQGFASWRRSKPIHKRCSQMSHCFFCSDNSHCWFLMTVCNKATLLVGFARF